MDHQQTPIGQIMVLMLRYVLPRFILAVIIALLFMFFPMPWWPLWAMYCQAPLVIFGLIAYLGKLLLDTFFYPRYPAKPRIKRDG
ncbi:MAG: hypothetical protein HY326_00665 [Chloroflexi bacterium]|nr:hypothetical protein [Chloroflexota bacterium]